MNKVSLNNTKNKKIFIIIAIILIIIAIIILILHSNHIRKKENEIFSLNKVVIYNSMGIINNENNPSLVNLNVNQFSDLSLYIDNKSENSQLDKYNTIKELYIDNINLSTNSENEKVLNYKNSLSLGKYENLYEPEDKKIVFNIQKNNLNNNSSNYSSPTFYTDCSNPITLGYINKDVITNYSVSNNSNIVSYNAKILKNTNLNLQDINATLNFTIHIINNAGHKLTCDMKLNISFDEDFVNNGYSYITISLSGNEYKFKR